MTLESLEQTILPPSSITELLNNPNSKIEDILIDNITFRFFNTGDPQLVRYFCNHVKDLLHLAFKLNEPQNQNNKVLWRYEQMGSRSFAILEHSDPTLTEAMLSNDQLRDIASSILWKKNPESVLLSRLSSLTLVAFLYNPSIAQSSCGYVLQMLNYVSEPSILSLFEIVCSSEDRNVVLQQWLLSLSFTDILYKEIENIQLGLFTSKNNGLIEEIRKLGQMSQIANQYCGLLKVLTYCAKSIILSESVRTHRFVELLNKDLGFLPQFIEDIRWESIASMYCAQTSELLRGFFNPSINILQDDELCKTLSGISAIRLLTTMTQSDSVLRPFMSIADITKLIVRLMIEHPDHCILHMAAREFLQTSFQHPKTRVSALSDAIPMILEALQKLTELMKAMDETDSKIDGKIESNEEASKSFQSSSALNAGLKTSNSPSNSPTKCIRKDEQFNVPELTQFNISLRASLFNVLNLAVNLGKTDQKAMDELRKIPNLFDFVRTELASYNQKSLGFYGGAAPPPQICNAKDMANDSVFRMRGF